MYEKRKFNPFNVFRKEVPMNRKKVIAHSVGVVTLLAFLAVFLGGWTVASAIVSRSAAPSVSKSVAPSVNSPEFGCGTSFYYPQAGTSTGLKLLGSTNDGAQANVACFLQAFQKCVPASIGFTVDSGGAEAPWLGKPAASRPVTTGPAASQPAPARAEVPGGANPTVKDYSFSTERQSSGCAISKSARLNMQPQPNETETCAGVKQTGTDLSFVGCGNSGTVTFPLDGPR